MKNVQLSIIYKRLLKFRILPHFILIVIILIISGVVIINSSAEDFLEFGKIKGVWSESKNEILYIGDNIILYNTADYSLPGTHNREDKIEFELETCALYYYATNINISVTDEQVKAKLTSDRIINDYIVNNEDFFEMLNGLGMSEDEYWDCKILFDITKKTLTVEKLLNNQRKIIEMECKNEPGIDIDEELEKWRLEKIEEILKTDNVRKIAN